MTAPEPELVMKKLRVRGCLIVAFAVWFLVATPVLLVVWGMRTAGGMGSMAEARKLRPKVEAIPDPDSLPAEHREYGVIRFPNGEWVLGIAKDSHALFSDYLGGGTVVTKDSRGRVRCFFGHVCGSGAAVSPESLTARAKSLDEFDAEFAKAFAEQMWP
jgi:hypothetical protein